MHLAIILEPTAPARHLSSWPSSKTSETVAMTGIHVRTFGRLHIERDGEEIRDLPAQLLAARSSFNSPSNAWLRATSSRSFSGPSATRSGHGIPSARRSTSFVAGWATNGWKRTPNA
jgi:hypothetical protein